ncbi:type I-E CRISPR-associated protein Cse1/CasA [Streptomyces roseoverticillatus]|uniref:type I-E CRISPR-associated protein Cse1/CasA n=1 Tax=Streptomyces roseoverticillatus TaxID=66429 RepID=UPI0033D17F17
MDADGDLVHGYWLTTADANGTVRATGLLGGLIGAHTVRRLELPAPTMHPALLRQLLLPVVCDAIGVPRTRQQWAERFNRGRFSDAEAAQLTEYLGPRYGNRFRLFDDKRSFAQVAGLEALNGETKSAAQLVPSIASGNNVPLFSSLTEGDELLLTPGQALLWLLHAHCWDTASIKTGATGDPQAKNGKTTGNPTGPLGQLGVTVPVGRNLFETLMLNTPVMPDGLDPADRPQWAWDERSVSLGWKSPACPEWSSRPAGGLLDLLTFQARRIRLFPCETEQGLRVHRVIVCAGDRLVRTPEWDPHTAWSHTAKPKAGQPQRRPRRHVSGRSAWQGLGTLLALELPVGGDGPYTSVLLRQAGDLWAERALPEHYPLSAEICGLEYGTQSAVVENSIGDSLPLPVAALLAEDDGLRDVILQCVRQADQVGRALDNLNNDLRRASGGEPLPREKGQRPSSRFLHSLDATMRRLLTGLRTVGEDDDLLERAELAWELSVRAAAAREAEALIAAAPPRAVVGRTEKVNGKEVVYRSGKAIGIFHKKLAEILTQVAWQGSGDEKAAA